MKFYILITIMLLPLLVCMTCVDENGSDTDTTSHSFTWETFEFGDRNPNDLMDIAVIDEDNIWAVGEITIDDTNNVNGYETYNAVHWDGKGWELVQIKNNYNQVIQQNAIFIINENNIWTAEAGARHWNGTEWKSYGSSNSDWDVDGRIHSIWGTSSDNIYFAGDNGSIVHYDGSNFEKMETGTTLNIQDIYGARNKDTGRLEIIVVASDYNELELLNIHDKQVSKLQTGNIDSLSANALWFIPDEKYFVVGAGIHYNSSINDTDWNTYPSGEVTSYYSCDISGNGINDVFVVGSFCEIVHYNGSTWYNYETEIPFTNGVFGAVSTKNDIVALSGYIGSKAVIVIGKRKIN